MTRGFTSTDWRHMVELTKELNHRLKSLKLSKIKIYRRNTQFNQLIPRHLKD